MASPNRGRAALVLAVVLSILASCESDVPIGSTDGSKEITFTSSDGVTLSGRVFGPQEGSAGVVLAHMYPSDQSAWFDFAQRLGERGYRVLTFNFRGYCPGGDAGCSQGEKVISAIWQDVEGAVAALRDEGATRIGSGCCRARLAGWARGCAGRPGCPSRSAPGAGTPRAAAGPPGAAPPARSG